MEAYAPLFALIGALALVGTATATWFSVASSRRLLEEERRYRARLYALQLVERWESVTHTARIQLRKRFAQALRERGPIPAELLTEPSPTGAGHDDHAEVILSFFNHLGLSLDNGVADPEVVRGFFKVPVAEWSGALAGYREQVLADRDGDAWPYLDALVAFMEADPPA